MGFLDRFRPATGLGHADAEARLQAVQSLPAVDLSLLSPVVTGDTDPRVRRAAARRLRDPRLLSEVAAGDADGSVREAAASTLLGMALEGKDEAAALAALAGLIEARLVSAVARSAALEPVARAALARLTDDRFLAGVARHGEHAALRLAALGRITDPREMAAVALKSGHRDVALAAVERVADRDLLASIAERGRDPGAARRARALVRGRDEESDDEAKTPRAADREAPLRLIEEALALSRSEDWDELPARLTALKDAWIDDIPEVDDDLDERFREACLVARRRLQTWQEERAERERRERETEERLGPRRRLCEAVEAVTGGDADAIAEVRAAWDNLPADDSPEAEALRGRFESGCLAIVEREAQEARRAGEVEAQARRDAEMKDAERQRLDNAGRMERLCAGAEKMIASDKAVIAKLERLQREVRAALQTPPPLPSQKDHDAIVHRLRTLNTELTPKIQSLRETERWQRWANAAVQEELCALMEDLARASEEEGADAGGAARGLRELMERWKAAGPAPPDRSLSLWNRFKIARDRVRARSDAHDQQQAEEHARNLVAKEALCERAEAVAASTEWIKTSEAIKALQAEWKAIGQVSRGHEKAVWERFRKACDQFFARRDEDMVKRRDEWSRNLQAKEALCARAEILADSTDWKNASIEIKKLQMEWKNIGPVRRNQSDAIWNRFRGACDRFFERFKNRDVIERQAHVVDREALCLEVEALAPAAAPVADAPAGNAADIPATDGVAQEAVAAGDPSPTAPTPSTEEMVGRLRAALERWRQMRHLPPDQMAPLNARFYGAFDRVLAAHPEAFHGTSLDADANKRRMEDLVTRVEKLTPSSSGDGPDLSSLSPAARLAATWREALATNTMGGRVAEDGKLKAAAEEVKRAQAAWQRLGYVPEPHRSGLERRFETACRHILGRRGAGVPAGASASRG